MRKFLFFVLLGLVLLASGACSKKGDHAEAGELFGLSQENNIEVDREHGRVRLYAILNGKYLSEPTRHAVISDSGKLSDKSIFRVFVSPEDFYRALKEVGAGAGNNMEPDTAESTFTEGSRLRVSFSWKDQEEGLDINDVILDSKGKPIDIRFSGNLDLAKEYKTGCITCLDSCWVGITSNASYVYGAVEKEKEVEFRGNMENLPLDGEPVIISYELLD